MLCRNLSAIRSVALWAAVCQVVLVFSSGAMPAQGAELVLENGDERLELSLEQVAALPQVLIVTGNDFTDGQVEYRGPLVRVVLSQLGLDKVETVRFTAANDYFVDIPTSDFLRYDAVLAMEVDGKGLSRRTKGPFWVMYPISDHPELLSRLYNSRLIWQVVKIESL